MPARPGRPRDPEGRRNNVCAKLSDAELAAVDEARGRLSVSEWVRLALVAETERQRSPAGQYGPQAMFVEQNRAARNGDCPHPPARVNKGLCGACGTHVGTSGGER